MPTTLEIAHYPASPAYQKDASLANTFAEVTKKIEGVQSVFTGIGVEHPNGYLLVGWDDLAAHQRLVADTKRFAAGGRTLVPTMAYPRAGVSLFHGVFADSARLHAALAAPVTEIAEVVPRGGAEVQALLERLVGVVNSGVSKAIAGVVGRVVEREGEWVIVIGWPSIDAHRADVDIGPLGPVVKELRAAAELTLNHVQLYGHGGAKL